MSPAIPSPSRRPTSARIAIARVVAGARRLRDGRAGDGGGVAPGELRDRARAGHAPAASRPSRSIASARRHLLPAPEVPAPARRTAGLHDHVADLRGEAVRSSKELAANDDPAADAGADGHDEHLARTAARAESELAPRRGARVVLHHRRSPDRLLDSGGERQVAPRDVRREVQRRPPVGESRGPDADRRRRRGAREGPPTTASTIVATVAPASDAGVGTTRRLATAPEVTSTASVATFVPPTSAPITSVPGIEVERGSVDRDALEPGRPLAGRPVQSERR